MKRPILIIAAVCAAAIAVLAIRYFRDPSDSGVLELSGTVEVTEVSVGFKVPGRIAELQVEEGQETAAGARLAVLDSAEQLSIVQQARAAVANAEAEFERARKDLDRYRSLSEQGAVTAQQFDAATKAFTAASALLDQARAVHRTASVRLEDLTATAPVAGVVLSRNAEKGETVAAGVAVYVLGDLAHPWVKVYVNETKLGLLKLGQTAQVFVDTFPGKPYAGRVTYIASEAEFTPKNVQTREERVKLVFAAKVSVTNIDRELKPGMPADVKIILK